MARSQKQTRKISTLSPAQNPGQSCLVADSPHSGRIYPADFNYSCSKDVLRQAEDAWIDKLFDFLPDIGVPFLQAKFPRSYIDANRDGDKVMRDFNQASKRGEHPTFTPIESGLIRSPVTPRHPVPVYNRPMPLREAFERVTKYHKPYHQRLRRMIEETKEKHGRVVHLNCHSMPSTLRRGTRQNSYDVILGTREGTTTDERIVLKLKTLLEAKGYKVGMNAPGFRGAEIVRRYGSPVDGKHSIQVEINRALYMDEKTLRTHQGMQKLKSDLKAVMSDFKAFCDAAPSRRFQAQPRIAPKKDC